MLEARERIFDYYADALNTKTERIRGILVHLALNAGSKLLPVLLQLTKFVMEAIKTPLSEVLASSLLIANGRIKIDNEVLQKPFDNFKDLYSKWMISFPTAELDGDSEAFQAEIHKQIEEQRLKVRYALVLLECSADELRLLDARFRMFGLVSAKFNCQNIDSQLGDILLLIQGELPLWEARIVVRMLLTCQYPIAELDTERV